MPRARKLKQITYEEMLELASVGAKVLQTRSVELAMKEKVRIQVLSSFTPAGNDPLPGTMVVDEDENVEQELIAGVAYNRNEAKITVAGVPDRPGVVATIFGALAEANVNVDMIVQNIAYVAGTTDVTFTVPRTELALSEDVLAKAQGTIGFATVTSDAAVAKISVVGVGMRSHAGVAVTMFKALGDRGINIQAITTSEIKVSVLIAEEYTELAVRVLHTAYGLGRGGVTRLATLSQRGRDFLGSTHAIMAGAMTWVSERTLVSAISNAGGFGVIACGAMPPAVLDAEIAATRALTDRPFGVNLITLHPAMDDLIDICGRHGVSHVVLAGGLPSGAAIARIKATGARLMCFAPTAALARKLVRSGVDAIVIEGSEAGGHIGPVSTSVLAQEILPAVTEVPVFVAGGIGRGSAIAAYLDMGASGVQLGTRFAAASESVAHDAFKRAFVRASARDAVASVQLDPRLPVIPVRALRNAGSEAFAAKQRDVAAEVDGRRADARRRSAGDRALLGGGAAPRGRRRRRGNGVADGRAVGRHGRPRRAGRRDHRRTGRRGGGGPVRAGGVT